MADDDVPAILPDGQSPRLDAFLGRHAIPANLYASAVDRAMQFAAGAAEDGPAGDSAARWCSYGARNIGGRIRALAQHPKYPLILYAGTAAGGVFKSSDGGDTWAPLGGPQAVFGVGALAIAPSDPSVLYIGTGEPVVQHNVVGGAVVSRTSYPSGRGFFRFREGSVLGNPEVGPAANVAPGTLGAADSFGRIAVDPRDAERCWMATHTGLWRRERGPVFRREPVPAGPPAPPALGSAATDVIAIDGWNQSRPDLVRLYAAFGGQGIYRGVFDRNAAGLNTAWDPILSTGLPAPCAPGAMTWDRIRLAVCASQPNHVYAVAENAGNATVLSVYHSSNAGDSWTARPVPLALLGAAAWYSLFIEVHPENPAIVVFGELNVLRSVDFGQNWEQILDWTRYDDGDHAQHADEHAAMFDAGDPRRLWLANDGGLSVAQDIVQGHPLRDRGWRKRSNGITAAMFNDIAVHPTYPQMLGGGLQDNGTYITFGGETWFSVWGGDGGQMAFEVGEPRVFVAPTQGSGAGNAGPGALVRSTVSAVSAVFTGSRAPLAADKDPPFDVFATRATVIETGINIPLHGALFVPVLERHPSSVGRFLVGRQNGGAYLTTNGGTSYTAATFTAAQFGGGDVSALGFGIQAGANADFWVGSTQGVVLRGVNAPPAATVWTPFNLAAVAGDTVTRIAVHPADDRYVAFCTASPTGNRQGRVHLTADRGANWTDISGLTGAGATTAGSLPPGPCTSLAFDPQPAAAAAQTLFVGTLAGVFVIRNLPRRSPAAGAPLPALVPVWARFSGVPSGANTGRAALPSILVEDLKVVSLPARTDAGVVAGSAETVRRTRLMAATFGRGMFACDITTVQAVGIPVGGPPARLYIRQSVIEDGLSYPRPTPETLNKPVGAANPSQFGGDPRFPIAGTGFPVPFTHREAFDIRIDNAPFQFFEDVLDGVEFDENLATRPVAAGERNVVYVQVHSCGWQAVASVTVHLYFAPSAAPPASPIADPLPNLHADFWAHWLDATLPAPAAAPAANAAAWQRAGVPATLTTIGPNQPAVARFEWQPPVTLATHVALLALVTTAAGVDPLTPAGQPTALKTLLRNERRGAFRIAPVTPFAPDLFIRDGLDDSGRLGGVAFGGRSPDIIVVFAEPATPATEFADRGDLRTGDRVRAAGDNFIYVRVQNRKQVDTRADVELFWAKSNAPTSAAADPAGPLTDNTKWQAIAAVGSATNVLVPAGGSLLVEFKLSNAPAPEAGVPNALAFIALIKANTAGDPEPLRTRITDTASLWRFFLQLADSNNAALRSVRYA